MKKVLLSILLMLLPMLASADAVEINGIWYNLVPKAMNGVVAGTGIWVYPSTCPRD